MPELQCLSCKTMIDNDPAKVRFLCPGCGQYEILRCGRCRSTATKYQCPGCPFKGPN